MTYIFHKPSNEISSLFHLSSTDGKLYARSSLDREQNDQYRFHLIASDGLYSSSPIEIRIRIRDLNDEIARFLFPNDQNETLVIDRTYWNRNDLICQIEIQDLDEIPNYSLLLIHRLDQLKNYDYLTEQKNFVQFDSGRFFLDQENRLFFNSTSGSQLDEGVYYLAFKVISLTRVTTSVAVGAIIISLRTSFLYLDCRWTKLFR